MANARVKEFQRAWIRFESGRAGTQNLHYKDIAADGVRGPATKTAIKKARYFLGVGDRDWRKNSIEITDELLATLANPFRRVKGYTRARNLKRRAVASRRRAARIRRWKAHRPTGKILKGTTGGSPHWGGARYVVEATRHIARRRGHPVTSTKRWPPIGGNYSSWHNTNQPRAWADDYATYGGAAHAQEIRRHWGNRQGASGTYAIYYVTVDGRIFAKQTLWAVQGHYDHVHDGARAG